MTREEYDKIKQTLVNILAKQPSFAPRALLDTLISDAQLSDSDARNSIWRMIDDGTVRLNLDREYELIV